MQSLEAGTRDWPGAVIAITSPGGATMFRPAAFVFDAPGGLAWVEPSYADPWGAATPALHVFQATREAWNAFVLADGRRLGVLPYADDADLVGDGLEWFRDWLRAEGRTWQQERARVLALIEGALQ